MLLANTLWQVGGWTLRVAGGRKRWNCREHNLSNKRKNQTKMIQTGMKKTEAVYATAVQWKISDDKVWKVIRTMEEK